MIDIIWLGIFRDLTMCSFTILIASLFSLPAGTVISTGWQSYTFLAGAVVAPACINVLFAITTSVFVGLLTQTSRVCHFPQWLLVVT